MINVNKRNTVDFYIVVLTFAVNDNTVVLSDD